jgi:malate dehydrogenase (oxaloacetate-decarboxylating)(NADP+)
MKLACVRQIADLAKEDISEEVASAYAGQDLGFGRDYIIPKPFDSRLILRIAPAVAAAAAASGVATRPIADLDAYRQRLMQMFAAGGLVMQPVFTAAAPPSSAASSMPKAKTCARCAPHNLRWMMVWPNPF